MNLAPPQAWSSILSQECLRKEEASSSFHMNDRFFLHHDNADFEEMLSYLFVCSLNF